MHWTARDVKAGGQSRQPPAKQTVNVHHGSKTGKKEVAERAGKQD